MMKMIPVLICSLLCCFGLNAQFASTNGPVGEGLVDAVYAFGDTAFADINNLPWRTTNGGDTWEVVLGEVPDVPNPDAYAKRGNVIYMGTNNHDRMYRSLDYGESWETFNNGLPLIVGFPAAVPTHLQRSGDRVFAGGTNFGLRYTDEADTAWVEVNKETGNLVFNISPIGKDSLMVTQGTGFWNYTYFSADNGDSWTQLPTEPVPVRSIASTGYGKIGNVLVGTTDAGGANSTYYSTDFGTTWILSNNGPAIVEQLIQPRKDLIYAVNFEGIYRTTDGINWVLIDEAGGGNSIACWKGDRLLFGSDTKGMWDLSKDADPSLRQQALPVATLVDQVVHRNSLYGLTDGNLFRFDGAVWERVRELDFLGSPDLVNTGLSLDLQSYNDLLQISTNNGLYRSEDGGQNFSAVEGFEGERIVLSYRADGLDLVVKAVKPNQFDPRKIQAELYYFNADSARHVQAELDGSRQNFPLLLQHVLVDGQTVYLSGGTKDVFVSTDNGRSWTQKTKEYNIAGMALFDGKLFFAAPDPVTGRVFYTEDGFDSHEVVSLQSIPRGNEFLEWWYFRDIFVQNGRLYIYQNDPTPDVDVNGLYYLTSTDAEWTYLEESLLPAPPSHLTAFRTGLYAAIPTWSVWSNVDLLSNTQSPASMTPVRLAHPNPTKGRLFIPNPREESWELYDLAGRLSLSGRTQEADLSSLPSGLYLLRMGGKQQKIVRH
ncbi:MAG: T9SS type A sorting domain-containing protein [Bacteroidota bacterium]